ncbi:MAG: hypothetical protein IH944_13415 [Armatimonadetes bacterium]|nr:hypothetical protein [Armatimonadota bacterium]
MNFRPLVTLVIVACLSASALAQVDPAQAKHSDEIVRKVQEIEIYNQILPVLITPKQADELLTVLEKGRAEMKRHNDKEYEMMKSFEVEIDAALKKARDRGQIPTEDFMARMLNMFRAFNMMRKAIIDGIVADLQAELNQTLNEGQIAAAAKAFNPRFFDPTLDPKTMTIDQRLELWIRVILIDPVAYDVMKRIALGR